MFKCFLEHGFDLNLNTVEVGMYQLTCHNFHKLHWIKKLQTDQLIYIKNNIRPRPLSLGKYLHHEKKKKKWWEQQLRLE